MVLRNFCFGLFMYNLCVLIILDCNIKFLILGNAVKNLKALIQPFLLRKWKLRCGEVKDLIEVTQLIGGIPRMKTQVSGCHRNDLCCSHGLLPHTETERKYQVPFSLARSLLPRTSKGAQEPELEQRLPRRPARLWVVSSSSSTLESASSSRQGSTGHTAGRKGASDPQTVEGRRKADVLRRDLCCCWADLRVKRTEGRRL